MRGGSCRFQSLRYSLRCLLLGPITPAHTRQHLYGLADDTILYVSGWDFGMKRRDVLSGLIGGATGALLPWRGVQAQIQESAQGAFLKGYLRTNWSQDPYAFGSYSYVATGAWQSDRGVLGASIERRVYFAGEAIHPHHNSTVHAAYESGIMTAQDVDRDTRGPIAVIGAGVSGLALAQRLSAKGRSVTVFEARDRIGGRIVTNRDLGVPLDLGASWIHGTHDNPIASLAQAMDTATVATDETYIMRGAGGRLMEEEAAPNWLEDVTTIQHNAGAARHDINLQAYMAQTEYSGDDVIFPQGYESLLPALDGDYEVKLSEPVSAISHDENGVVITSNGTNTEFDVVVVTLPLGVLKANTVTFAPALPPATQNAIAKLGMGTLDKLYLQYEEPFWDEDITWIATPENGLPKGQFNQWLNLYKYLGQPIIMAFNGGPPALALSMDTDEELIMKAKQSLEGSYF